MEKESESIPDKVLKKVNMWLKSLDKITIKNVTILEAPKEIMDVLLADKKINSLKESNALEHIVLKKGKDAKTQIEKNTYF